jgi:hypothetical protein
MPHGIQWAIKYHVSMRRGICCSALPVRVRPRQRFSHVALRRNRVATRCGGRCLALLCEVGQLDFACAEQHGELVRAAAERLVQRAQQLHAPGSGSATCDAPHTTGRMPCNTHARRNTRHRFGDDMATRNNQRAGRKVQHATRDDVAADVAAHFGPFGAFSP